MSVTDISYLPASVDRKEPTAICSKDGLAGVPLVTLKDGTKAPEYLVCEKCGAHLHISPNSKGAFSYQGCDCENPEWMQYE